MQSNSSYDSNLATSSTIQGNIESQMQTVDNIKEMQMLEVQEPTISNSSPNIDRKRKASG